MFQLTLATQNECKLRELEALISAHRLPISLQSLAQGGIQSQAQEVGATFGQNALLKAAWAAARTSGWALADDSGLCVDSLGGAPGIHSARWSGGGDEANNALLLEKLAGVPVEKRAARYRCALALCDQHREALLVEADVEGRIAEAPRGSWGFGYDPLFEIPEWGLTFAEVELARKKTRSHRARAFRKLLPLLGLVSRQERDFSPLLPNGGSGPG